MISRITVRRDQPNGQKVRSSLSGWRTACPSHITGRVRRVPSPVIRVNSVLIESAPFP